MRICRGDGIRVILHSGRLGKPRRSVCFLQQGYGCVLDGMPVINVVNRVQWKAKRRVAADLDSGLRPSTRAEKVAVGSEIAHCSQKV